MTVQTDRGTVHSMRNTTIDRLGIDRDVDLVEALRGRHASAAEQLVARYGDRAYRLAL
jgi:hypothetical protein